MVSLYLRRTTAVFALLPVLVSIPEIASADFDLPILNRVPKILSVPEDIPLTALDSFTEVHGLSIEIRMVRGNMLTDRMITYLESKFDGVPKRIVLKGILKPVHIDQLRRLTKLEVRYEAGPLGLEAETINSLYALGPVRKVVVLSENFRRSQLDRVRKLKFFAPAVQLKSGSMSQEQLGWLAEDRRHRTTFLLPSSVRLAWIYDLTVVQPLGLEVRTVKNRLDDNLLAVLKDLKRVDYVIVVDGMLTLKQVKQFCRLDRFTLKVTIDKVPRIIPGLARLLNRIAPPQESVER